MQFIFLELNEWNHPFFCFCFALTRPHFSINMSTFCAKSLECSPYKITMASLSINDQSNKKYSHILWKTCARIRMVLIDSNVYSAQAGTHALSLNVVIYALLLSDLHRKKTRAQYRFLKEKLFIRYRKSTSIDKTSLHLLKYWPNEHSIGRSLLTGISNLRPPSCQKGSKMCNFFTKSCYHLPM